MTPALYFPFSWDSNKVPYCMAQAAPGSLFTCVSPTVREYVRWLSENNNSAGNFIIDHLIPSRTNLFIKSGSFSETINLGHATSRTRQVTYREWIREKIDNHLEDNVHRSTKERQEANSKRKKDLRKVQNKQDSQAYNKQQKLQKAQKQQQVFQKRNQILRDDQTRKRLVKEEEEREAQEKKRLEKQRQQRKQNQKPKLTKKEKGLAKRKVENEKKRKRDKEAAEKKVIADKRTKRADNRK